jgi:hypothetical protein
MHEDLRAVTFEEASLDEVPLATFVVPGLDAAVTLVIGRVADYFGADPARELIRLRFGGGARYLRRRDMYGLLGSSPTKGFGDGGYASLPGYSVPGQAAEFEFRCPVDGCPDSPVFLFAFDGAPRCDRHHQPLELV